MCESRHHSTPLCDQGRALHSRVAPHPCDADFGALLLICEVFLTCLECLKNLMMIVVATLRTSLQLARALKTL